ncbi:MAG: hypothetical protein R3228_08420, partial [Halioglobus sp.]|nr:hypothetical protein [Halioglobus sp.]
LNVTPADDAPTATNMNQVLAYNEGDASVALDDIVVTDVDTGDTITATLTLADTATGSLSANDGASYSAVTGVWSITGTVAQVNTALANVAFTPIPTNEVATTITTHIEDAAGTGPADGIISLNVTPANDPPTATNLDQVLLYNEGDTVVAIGDIVVADIDAGDTITATLTLANTATGSLSANDGATYNASTGVWSITDSVANVNAALASVVFNPLAQNDVNTSIATHIEDSAGTGPADGTITLTVRPANDAPVATNMDQLLSYDEGDTSVALDDIVVRDADTGDIVTVTLTLEDPASGSLSASGAARFDAAAGVWTVAGTVDNVNAALASVEFLPNDTRDAETRIITHVEDAAGTGPGDGIIVISVNPVNDTPTASNMDQALSYNEGEVSVALDDIAVQDPDRGDVITATLTLADPASGALSSNDGASYDAGTGVWSITGSVDAVNTALAGVVFNPAADNDGATAISTHIEDAAGTGPADGTITLTAVAANDAPTATNMTQQLTYTEDDAAVALADIVVSDVDAGDIITATLTLADPVTGSLSANDGASYNAASGTWTISGTVAEVNAALAGVVFNPAADNEADTTIITHVEDAAGTGPADGVISLDVIPVNDAPGAANLDQVFTYTEEDSAVALDDIVVTDVDAGEFITATLTLADPSAGSLSANDGASYDAAGGVWRITDTLANVNRALAGVVFTPGPGEGKDTTISTQIEDAAGAGPAEGLIRLLFEGSTLIEVIDDEPELPVAEEPAPIGDDTAQEEPEEPQEAREPEAEPVAETAPLLPETVPGTSTAQDDDGDTIIVTTTVELELDDDRTTVLYNTSSFSGYAPEIEVNEITATQTVTVHETVFNTLVSMDTSLTNFTAFTSSQDFSTTLDELRNDLIAQQEWGRVIVDSSVAIGSGLSIGYVAWLIRSGVILSTVLSSMPAWRFIDPTPVLATMVSRDDEDDESLESIVAQADDDIDTDEEERERKQ